MAQTHIGTLQCAEGFHSWNGHSVLKDTDFRGPGDALLDR